jgi:hypothetical protein
MRGGRFADLVKKAGAPVDVMTTIGGIIKQRFDVPNAQYIDVRKKAMEIHDKVHMSEELNGAGAVNIHTACVYISCRLHKVPASLDTMALNKATLNGLVANICTAMQRQKK